MTLTADKVNMRVGPARDYAIRWVYRRDGLPLKVVRLHEGWRLVEDPDGARGWILARFLSRARGAVVTGKIDIAKEPNEHREFYGTGIIVTKGNVADYKANPGKVDFGDLWGKATGQIQYRK